MVGDDVGVNNSSFNGNDDVWAGAEQLVAKEEENEQEMEGDDLMYGEDMIANLQHESNELKSKIEVRGYSYCFE